MGEMLGEFVEVVGKVDDDWDEFDRAMRDEARAAVLVTPGRIRSNG